MLYPLTFKPIFKERVWGGRKLAELYQKSLPAGVPIGESWEISDRPGDVSVVADGPLAGRDLRWLMLNHQQELLGDALAPSGRFPLLIKILDAREKLSLQVHPPPSRAAELGGEPKTEMWFIADADPGAELYAGLKRGVTRAQFEQKIASGRVAECFHRLPAHREDALFLPSGRVHAIGAGLVIFEIQQNSDTTYRVFDWNRAGLDGKPRELHIADSLASIDFGDIEPTLADPTPRQDGPFQFRTLASCSLFEVSAVRVLSAETMPLSTAKLRILAVVEGRLKVRDRAGNNVELAPGQFCLIPASVQTEVWMQAGSEFLMILTGQG